MRDEMDALVGASARINDADVEALSLRPAEADLMEEIMSTPALETVGSGEPPRRRWASGRRLAAIAGVAAVTTAAVFAIQSSRDTGPVWAASMVAVADKAPRLHVDDPAWTVSSADVHSGAGTIGFTDGDASLYVHWGSKTDYSDLAEFWRSDAKDVESTTVLGHEAEVFHLSERPQNQLFITVWRQDGYVIQADASVTDRAENEAVLRALRKVDVDTWLEALPDDVVGPDELNGVVAELMADVPLPAGVDEDSLVDPNRISYRHLIGYDLTDAVACAWIGRWIEARDSGDEAAAEEVAATLGTVRDWTLVREMKEPGPPKDLFLEYADAIAEDGRLYDEMNLSTQEFPTGETVDYDGKEDPEGTFRALFQCDGQPI